jgi:hypothetical protein
MPNYNKEDRFVRLKMTAQAIMHTTMCIAPG